MLILDITKPFFYDQENLFLFFRLGVMCDTIFIYEFMW